MTGQPDVDARNDSGDGFKVNEDTIRNPLDVLKNDVDPEGDTFKVTGVTQGSKGIVEIGVNGANVLYTPDPNFIGTDTFTYTITDSTGATDTAKVTVVVVDVGEPPDAVNDAATVVEDSAPNVINVLANDKLVENPGGSLTITKVTQGANGTVADSSGRARPGLPAQRELRRHRHFTYTITDNKGGTDTATVTVTVNNMPDAPDAKNDTATVSEGQQEQHHRRAGQRRGSRRRQADGDQGHARHGRHGGHRRRRRQRDLHAQRRLQRQRHLHLHDHRSGRLHRHRHGAGDGDRHRSRLQGQRRRRRVLRQRNAAGTNVEVFANDTGTGTPIFSAPIDTAPRLTFDTLGGNDRLIVDAVNGNPIPSLRHCLRRRRQHHRGRPADAPQRRHHDRHLHGPAAARRATAWSPSRSGTST